MSSPSERPTAGSDAGPDFLVIGAQKAGTGSLYHLLKRQPRLRLPQQTELAFFDRDSEYEQGLSYYARHFDPETSRIQGEVSPGYLGSKMAPMRIAAALPSVRLIVCLRDPLERTISAYRMQVLKGSEERSLRQALVSEDHYIRNSLYGECLSGYLEYFAPESILLLRFEDLVHQTSLVLERIGTFLGVPELETADRLPHRNRGGTPRSLSLVRALSLLFRARNRARQTPFRWIVDDPRIDRLGRRLRNRLTTLNRSPAKRLEVPREITEYLSGAFVPDLETLSERMEFETSSWIAGWKTN